MEILMEIYLNTYTIVIAHHVSTTMSKHFDAIIIIIHLYDAICTLNKSAHAEASSYSSYIIKFMTFVSIFRQQQTTATKTRKLIEDFFL